MTLAERLAPHMSGVLVHPGDDTTEPFPVAPIPVFTNTATLPKGMAEDMAEQAGLPSPDFARIYTETWIHTLETVCNVTLVDNTELADLHAELATLRAVANPKANELKTIKATCGNPAGRAMVRNLHTPEPVLPCEMVKHECRKR